MIWASLPHLVRTQPALLRKHMASIRFRGLSGVKEHPKVVMTMLVHHYKLMTKGPNKHKSCAYAHK